MVFISYCAPRFVGEKESIVEGVESYLAVLPAFGLLVLLLWSCQRDPGDLERDLQLSRALDTPL